MPAFFTLRHWGGGQIKKNVFQIGIKFILTGVFSYCYWNAGSRWWYFEVQYTAIYRYYFILKIYPKYKWIIKKWQYYQTQGFLLNLFFLFFFLQNDWFDWLLFNASFSSISGISWHEKCLFINLDRKVKYNNEYVIVGRYM